MASHSLSEAGPSSGSALPITATENSATILTARSALEPAGIAQLMQAVQEQGVEMTMQTRFAALTLTQKASMVVNMLNIGNEQAEVVGMLVDHVWNTYVLPETLWNHYEGGEVQFKKDVGFDNYIVPTLKLAAETRRRKAREIAHLEREWGVGWDRVIEPSGSPVTALPVHYVQHLATLARHKITLLDARELLCYVKDRRILNPGRGIRTDPLITVADIQKVKTALMVVSKSRKILPQQCTTADIFSQLQAATPGGVAGRITEIVSPAATPIPPLPSSVPAVGLRSFTDQVPPQIHSLKETEIILVLFTISV